MRKMHGQTTLKLLIITIIIIIIIYLSSVLTVLGVTYLFTPGCQDVSALSLNTHDM